MTGLTLSLLALLVTGVAIILVIELCHFGRYRRNIRRWRADSEYHDWCIRNDWCCEHDKDVAVCVRWHP